MSYKAVDFKFSISEDALTTPSSTQQFPLGNIVEVVDSAQPNSIKRFMYVKSHTTLVAFTPYAIVAQGTSGSEWLTAAPAILSSAVQLIGIPQVGFTSGYYGFVQIAGAATYLTGGLAVVANASVKILAAGTTLITDSSTGAQSNNTIGWNVSLTSTTPGVSGTVILQGARAVVSSV